MSLWKYFGEQSDSDHGGRLFWSNHMEAPFRGRNAPLLTRDEFDKIETINDFKSGTFNLGDPAQKAIYDSIMDKVSNGWYTISHRMHRWNDQGEMVVYVEWLQRYSDLPPHVRNNSGVTL